jgi:hypothetical protein
MRWRFRSARLVPARLARHSVGSARLRNSVQSATPAILLGLLGFFVGLGPARPTPLAAQSDAGAGAGGASAVTPATPASARVVEFDYTPVASTQIALWIEDTHGKYLATVALTEAVAIRGIGNRPGASQMNSGFRWPYGRREGVLPIWAHQRMTGDNAQPFKRVIFQNRTTEGLASRTSNDYSPDNYFCLSFNNSKSKKDALDAVSCASAFSSDKGRFMTDQDVANGYSEPYEDVQADMNRQTPKGSMQPLALTSLYPPRRDVKTCAPTCYESADVANYDSHAHSVMPEIDSVSMATPQGGEPQQHLFSVPSDWTQGDYRACIEVNVEGDYNASYNDTLYPTPSTPASSWDSWATGFGYPYRGQPSVVYCVPFTLQGTNEATFTAAEAIGSVGGWDTAAPSYGQLANMDGMSDDPTTSPGSGGDRLKAGDDGSRFTVIVKPPVSCEGDTPPTGISDLSLAPYPNKLEAHEWAQLGFKAASDDSAVFDYDVRVSTDPITDEDSFMHGQPAKSATIAADELRIPIGEAAGAQITADLGGLIPETHYYVGVRAVDSCAMTGPFSVAEITTPKREFATVSPCFIATAAYGTPLASEISVLRRFRDRYLGSNALGRAFVDVYYTLGPKLAAIIRRDETLRAVSRGFLAPLVAAARSLAD